MNPGRKLLAAVLLPLAQSLAAPALAWTLYPEPPASGFVMNLDLLPTTPFQTIGYGLISWNQLAENALAKWNQIGIGSGPDYGFFRITSPTVTGNACARDGINEVRWASTLCGMSYGSALAVTRYWTLNGVRVEEDVLFNTNVPFNAYSGQLVQAQGGGTLNDFYRVALHEFGHAAGLDHPDEAGQSVFALMNAAISNIDSPQADDIAGVHAIAWNAPVYTLTLTITGSGTVSGGLSCGPGSCSGNFSRGSTITLTATPGTKNVFSGWGGACSGTGTCTVILDGATSVSAGFAQTGSASTRNDFNGDGKADILWRHTNGQNAIWQMNGSIMSAGSLITTVADSGWNIVGVGDFNGDGKADILWRHSSGQNSMWLMSGSTLLSGTLLNTVADVNWTIVGVGDFNGDGKDDILWRHGTTGQNVIWLMNGPALSAGAFSNTVSDANWKVVGIGDFNGDGKADVFWRHGTTGQNAVWIMDGIAVSSGALINTVADANWKVAGVGDFNKDGNADIFWRHGTTGQNVVWLMNGSALALGAFANTVADTGWSVASVGDLNGDGKADIFWRHSTTGQNVVWIMNGANLASGAFTTSASDTGWQVKNR